MNLGNKHLEKLTVLSIVFVLRAAVGDEGLRQVQASSEGTKDQIKCPVLLTLIADKERKYLSDAGAVYRAVLESPDDDSVRLESADMLTDVGGENSEERAEFIRTQVVLSRELGDAHKVEDLALSDRERVEELKAKQGELLSKYGREWVPKIKGVIAYDFRRGYLEGAVIDKKKLGEGEEAFVKLLKELKEHGIRRIEFQGFSAYEIVDNLKTEEMKHFTEVVAQKAGLSYRHIESLAENPHIKHLRRLDLDWNQIGEGGVRLLYSEFEHLRSRGRLNRYIPEDEFQEIGEGWIRNRGFAFEMRRDAFLELVDSYGVTLNYDNIKQRFSNTAELKEVLKQLLEDARFKKRILASYDYNSAAKYYSLLEKEPDFQRKLVEAVLEYESDPARLARNIESHVSNIPDIIDEGVFAQSLLSHAKVKDKAALRTLAEIYPLLKSHNGDWGKAREAYLSDEKVSTEKKAEHLKQYALTSEFETLINKVPEKERSKVKLAMHEGSDALFFRRLAEKYKIPQSIIEKMSPESMTYQAFNIPPEGKKVILGAPEEERVRYRDYIYFDEKQREVTLKKSFKMKRTEVTQFEYALVMKKNQSSRQEWPVTFEITIEGKKLRVNNRPVDTVTWYEAQEYAKKLSELTGKKYRIPFEVEWEYAARAGTTTPWSFGSSLLESNDNAWTDANSETNTHPVAEKRPNRAGLYDVHGNVWEWCEDASGPSRRVMRGGCFFDAAENSRSATQSRYDHGHSMNILGFRLVEEVP